MAQISVRRRSLEQKHPRDPGALGSGPRSGRRRSSGGGQTWQRPGGQGEGEGKGLRMEGQEQQSQVWGPSSLRSRPDTLCFPSQARAMWQELRTRGGEGEKGSQGHPPCSDPSGAAVSALHAHSLPGPCTGLRAGSQGLRRPQPVSSPWSLHM